MNIPVTRLHVQNSASAQAPRGVLFGMLWFTHEDEFPCWRAAVGAPQLSAAFPIMIDAQVSGQWYHALLIAHIGSQFPTAALAQHRQLDVLSVPLVTYDRDQHPFVLQLDRKTTFFFRLLPAEEIVISVPAGADLTSVETSPQVRELTDHISATYTPDASPFFAENHANFYPMYQTWLALAIKQSALVADERAGQYHADALESDLQLALDYVQPAQQYGIDNLGALHAALRLRENGQRELDELQIQRNHIAQLGRSYQATHEQLGEISSDDGVMYTNGPRIAISLDLGKHIAPELNAWREQCRVYAAQLSASAINEIRAKGVAITRELATERPSLGLMGIFSSGKTSLVNTLLTSDDPTRRFVEKTAPNTAVAVQIHAPAFGHDEEEAHFEIGEHFSCQLIGPNSHDGTPDDIPLIESILRLLAFGAITNLTMTYAPSPQPPVGAGAHGYQRYAVVVQPADVERIQQQLEVLDEQTLINLLDLLSFNIPLARLAITPFVRNWHTYSAEDRYQIGTRLRYEPATAFWAPGTYSLSARITIDGVEQMMRDGELFSFSHPLQVKTSAVQRGGQQSTAGASAAIQKLAREALEPRSNGSNPSYIIHVAASQQVDSDFSHSQPWIITDPSRIREILVTASGGRPISGMYSQLLDQTYPEAVYTLTCVPATDVVVARRTTITLGGHEEQRLHVYVNLATPDGWRVFTGEWSEKKLTSLLVTEVNLSLKRPVLSLTSIADTPGLGSPNRQHDFITHNYLQRAAGIIFMIASNREHSQAFDESLERLVELLKEASKQAEADSKSSAPHLTLEEVLFVINVFDASDIDLNARVESIEAKIVERLNMNGLGTRWSERQTSEFTRSLFVVRLRDVEQRSLREKLYGFSSTLPLIRRIKALFHQGGGYRRPYQIIQNELTSKWDQFIRQLDIEEQSIGQDNGRIASQLRLLQTLLGRYLSERLEEQFGAQWDEAFDVPGEPFVPQQIGQLDTITAQHLGELETRYEAYQQALERARTSLTDLVAERSEKDAPSKLQLFLTHIGETNECIYALNQYLPLDRWRTEVNEQLDQAAILAPEFSRSHETLSTFDRSALNATFQNVFTNWPSWKNIGDWGKKVGDAWNNVRGKPGSVAVAMTNAKAQWDQQIALVEEAADKEIARCRDYLSAAGADEEGYCLAQSYCAAIALDLVATRQQTQAEQRQTIQRKRAEVATYEPERQRILESLPPIE